VYCTEEDVRMIVETSLDDNQIMEIIEMSDAEIDRRIGAQSTSDRLVKKLSILITAHTVKTRQPRSQATGEYREDAGDVLEVWEREVEGIYRLYRGVSIEGSEYRHIDEDRRYPSEV
jgi:hypothetical protein